MKRRDLLTGAVGLTVAGGGAAVAVGDLDIDGDDAGINPVVLETIDAPGSEAGTTTVPQRGRVTFVELFATWCTVCQHTMEPLSVVHHDVGEDVQFVSVTSEPVGNTVTRDDVAAWWTANGGDWTVALDTDLELTEQLDAGGVPYAFVLDESNTVTWSERGYKSADAFQRPIEAALTDE
ncbi:TlpA family protein disulfide reductase [Natrinema amylolyticum]|uniref:TlpA family protein disulfide reductase n=1 Tax=Natrinema amylolyticum TaxID=2878679 RepID=UPI001CFA04E6|nr:TlpA disulfide reductase family protein [Natrinema amylolyticum]